MDVMIALGPLVAVAVGALALMLAEAFGSPAPGKGVGPGGAIVDAGAGRAGELGLIATVVLMAGALVSLGAWLGEAHGLEGVADLAPYLVIDRFFYFFSFILCLGGALSTLLASGYLAEHEIDKSEFFPLMLLSTVGAMALVAAGDLLSLFIALETMSLGVYCLIGLRRSRRASEAALKYFLLGSFAAALMLFGAALLYGVTGKTDLVSIGQHIATLASDASLPGGPQVLLALVLLLVGLAFKVSAVPFHMWTPDAYEGAPTPATNYMAVAVKAAAFAVMLRVLLVAFGTETLMSWGTGWPPALALMAALSMTVANLIAGTTNFR